VKQKQMTLSSLEITKVECVTSIGKRAYMEDTVYCPRELINERFYVAFVFDGHNGPEASHYLRNSFTRSLSNHLRSDLTSEKLPIVMTEFITKLGHDFKRKQKMDGSTITGLIIDVLEDIFHMFNLGDSITMLYGIQGKLLFVTRPDSTDCAEERQRLKALAIPVEKDMQSMMWRMYGLNMSKAFGNYHTGQLEQALQISGRKITYNVWKMPKSSHHVNVLIASDGLFDEIKPEHIAQVPIFRRMKLESLMSFVHDEGFKGDNFAAIRLHVVRKK